MAAAIRGIGDIRRVQPRRPSSAHPSRRLIAIDIAQEHLDVVAMRIEPRQPGERGALIGVPLDCDPCSRSNRSPYWRIRRCDRIVAVKTRR
jgi:hypothetical protein